MAPRGRAISRSPAERLLAWIVTGPAGHLWSVVADVVVLWARYARARARGGPP
jgi:hypothetical protein